ncbi:MAG: type 2 isopentenyl-diphosphate Delta-isomerase [Candidatus Atabeyarchaeum deiterrae]
MRKSAAKPREKEQIPPNRLTSERKLDHIRICLTKDVQALQKKTGFQDVELIHNAIPEIDMSEVKTETELFDRKLAFPLIIAGMTGGHPTTKRINETLARVAQETGIGMGVGSQRAAIEDASLVETFSVVRKVAPDILVIGNLGAPQLSRGYGVREAKKAVEMIDADALAIHLNPLQEAVQPEGETSTKQTFKKIADIADQLEVPVITKETGCGIAYEQALRFAEINVKGVDVGGAGGTSWPAVEAYRQLGKGTNNCDAIPLGFTFRDWGISTAASIVEVSTVEGLKTIATGGVRNGIDVAKAIALGADVAGVALPFLKPAYMGDEETLRAMVLRIAKELRTVMYLTESRNTDALGEANLVLGGKLSEWLTMRGFEPRQYAKRRRWIQRMK